MTRASDAERERAMVVLRRHYAAGRIDADELERRVERATRASYRHELTALFADLPRHAGVRVRGAVQRVDRAALRAHATTFAAVNAGLVGLWALTGGGEFWPVWSIVPWGVGLALHARCSLALRRLFGGGRRRTA